MQRKLFSTRTVRARDKGRRTTDDRERDSVVGGRRSAVLLLLLLPLFAHGQGRIEAGGLYHVYTGGFEAWRGGFVAGEYRMGGTTVRGEWFWHDRFGDTGVSYLADVTHDFNPRFYSRVLAHTSSGGFFIPKLRTELQGAMKWGARNQFVTQFALGYTDAKDVHQDYTAALEGIYYFTGGWVAQASVRWNVSNPESEVSRYHYFSLSHQQARQQFVVRGAFGREAYALVGPLTLFQDYASWTAGAAWRQWIGASWGVNVVGDYYRNPYFQHYGAQVGLFKTF